MPMPTAVKFIIKTSEKDCPKQFRSNTTYSFGISGLYPTTNWVVGEKRNYYFILQKKAVDWLGSSFNITFSFHSSFLRCCEAGCTPILYNSAWNNSIKTSPCTHKFTSRAPQNGAFCPNWNPSPAVFLHFTHPPSTRGGGGAPTENPHNRPKIWSSYFKSTDPPTQLSEIWPGQTLGTQLVPPALCTRQKKSIMRGWRWFLEI